MRRLLPFVLVACGGSPELPSGPPVDRGQRVEGFKAVAGCVSDLQQETRITLEADAVAAADGPVIRFRLTNVSNEPLRLYSFQLPWGNPNSIEVAAVTLRGEILSVGWPIADPGPQQPITLLPSASLTGDFVLAHRVEQLGTAVDESDILITWCYAFRALGDKTARRLSGVAVMKRRAV